MIYVVNVLLSAALTAMTLHVVVSAIGLFPVALLFLVGAGVTACR